MTDHSGDVGTLYAAGPLSSVNKDNVKSFPEVKDVKPKPIQVATITLNDLLDRNGVETLDFLSMDIEGAEPAALAGFDIERFRPALVCIEAHGAGGEEIAAYFQAHGYERIDEYLQHDRVNWYYKPKGAPDGEASPSSGETR